MVEIYAVNIHKEFSETEQEQLLQFVSEDKREKVKKRKNKKSSIGTLYGEVLVRYAVMKRLGINSKEIQFQYSEHGKPYLVGQNPAFFNVSHSGDWVVCAIGEQEVGIDIEKVSDNRLKVAKRFFTEEEYEEILKQPEEEQPAYFCLLWTLRESYLKWSGQGLTVPLNSFRFHKNRESQQFELRKLNQNEQRELEKIQFRQYAIDRNYQLSVCSLEVMFCDEVQVIAANQLIEVMNNEKAMES